MAGPKTQAIQKGVERRLKSMIDKIEAAQKEALEKAMAEKKKWIKKAIGSNKGALHRKLGVPEGEKIPAGKMAKAAHSDNPTIRKEVALAHTLGSFKHKASRYSPKAVSKG